MAETSRPAAPYPGFRFIVKLGDVRVAGFTECSGLESDIEIEEHAEGGENEFVRKFPGRRRQGELVLRRGIVGLELWQWFQQQEPGKVKPKSIAITVEAFKKNERGLVFELEGAFPKKWQGPQLNAAQSAVAIETLEIVYHGIRVDPEKPEAA